MKSRKEYQRQYHLKNKKKINERTMRHHFRFRYGISKEDAQALIEKAYHKCQICSSEFSKESPPHIDHNHTTGKVRGVLCRTCNSGLGFFKDSSVVLQLAINYLKELL